MPYNSYDTNQRLYMLTVGERVPANAFVVTDRGTIEPTNSEGHIVVDGDCAFLVPVSGGDVRERVRDIVEKTAVYSKALNKCPVPVAREFITLLVDRVVAAIQPSSGRGRK